MAYVDVLIKHYQMVVLFTSAVALQFGSAIASDASRQFIITQCTTSIICSVAFFTIIYIMNVEPSKTTNSPPDFMSILMNSAPTLMPMISRMVNNGGSSGTPGSTCSDNIVAGRADPPIVKTENKIEYLVIPGSLGRIPSGKNNGFDIHSASEELIPARSSATISTGLVVLISGGSYGQIFSLNQNPSVDIRTQIIDPNCQKELKIVVHNHGDEPFLVGVGDRIAKMIIEKRISYSLENRMPN